MVTVYYYTGWTLAYLHTAVADKWNSLPLNPLPGKRFWHFITFDVQLGQDFAMTDGAGGWDNPYGGGNYEITSTRLALFKGKVISIEENSSPILVISDLDSTMIGDTESACAATSRFTQFWLKKHFFNESKLVYNTGRSLQVYLTIHNTGYDFIDPDLLVTCVGSDAYSVNAVRST
jgi:hypothetical protein